MSHPLRSLLLTFDQLAPEQITTSTGTVTLSQHYRQQEGWQSITGDQRQASVQDLKRVLVADGERDNISPNAWPDTSLKFEICSKHNVDDDLQQHLKSAVSPNQTLWIHVDNATKYCSVEVSAMVDTCRKHLSNDTLFALTAFQMNWEQPEHTFDVLANDNLMRVPAFLEQAEFAEFYLQAVTSSHDLLHTLLLHAAKTPVAPLQQEENPDAVSVAPCNQPWDLRQLAINPGILAERNLALQFGRFRAVRTQNFLYVAEIAPDTTSNHAVREGLYLKPQDRWNVHNVCSEYVETADTLRKQLGLN